MTDTASIAPQNQPLQNQPESAPQPIELLEPTIRRYFATLNAGEFEDTARLFAATGALKPPFEQPVVGHDAIATYLHREAIGFKLIPHRSESEILESGEHQVKVLGKVQTPYFGVNVGWTFLLNAASEILWVEVKLLAALKELMHLKR